MAAQLVVRPAVGRPARRVPAAGRGHRPHIKDGHFTDAAGFREANAAFHLFPVEATGNQTLIEAHRRLLVQEYMGQVLTPTVELVGDITQDHRRHRRRLRAGRPGPLLAIIAEHNEHAKATMRAGIEQAGAAGKG